MPEHFEKPATRLRPDLLFHIFKYMEKGSLLADVEGHLDNAFNHTLQFEQVEGGAQTYYKKM